MKILAIDSGLERTGYFIFEIDQKSNSFKIIEFGLIKTNKKESDADRLSKIYFQLEKIIDQFQPKILVLEKLFFNTNQKTLVSIAQSQGVSMLLASIKKLKVKFLTPLSIKQTITGYGRADKQQVRKMVKLLLPNINLPTNDDVVDAIACGLAFFYSQKDDWKN